MRKKVFLLKVFEVIPGREKPSTVPVKSEHLKITENTIDAARKAAREIVEQKMDRMIRSLSVGPRDIVVYAYPKGVKKKPMTMKASRV